MTRTQFIKYLREALNHLYHFDRLKHNPLASLLGVAGQIDTPAALQTSLIEAINVLKPTSYDPTARHDRQVYDLLLYRYVQQFSQKEVADQLGISVRQLRREQQTAVEALAYHLLTHFQIEAELADDLADEPAELDEVAPPPVLTPSVDQELAWLKQPAAGDYAELGRIVPDVLDLLQPLLAQHGVEVEVVLAESLPYPAIPAVGLRQLLLNVLGVVIDRTTDGRVRLGAEAVRSTLRLTVSCRRPKPQPITADEAASLDIVRQMVDACGGTLAHALNEAEFVTRLTLPALQPVAVLVIDDNADTLQLLTRYTLGTRYQLTGCQDPNRALQMIEQTLPQLIVLDVMMPQMDGWEVLGRLRQHPRTQHIPIIICSILVQEALAYSLGAGDFVRKPVSRRDFLAALDRQTAGRSVPVSRSH
jgi:CheY-like chemotaxis protein